MGLLMYPSVGSSALAQQPHHIKPYYNRNGSYNVDVHIVNDFTFLFNGDEYQGTFLVFWGGACCVLLALMDPPGGFMFTRAFLQ